MIKVGITGGICSGKTTICKYLEEMGYTIIYMDKVTLMLSANKEIKNQIIKEFGNDSYINNKYNKKYIADIVFNNKNKLKKLNKIFKPFIIECIKNTHSIKNIIFYESAIIYEQKIESMFDYIICIYADTNSIMERLKTRNNYSDKEIDSRLKNQLDPMMKVTLSNFSINTNNKKDYKKELKEIIEIILKQKGV